MLKSATLVLAFLASLASAATLDVFVPPIIDPTTGTVWKVGTQQNVTW